MKSFPYSFIRRSKFSALANQVSEQKLVINLATDFVKQIEAGNLDTSYQKSGSLNKEDILGASLESMRDRLKAFSLEENQRHWVSEGLAKFVDILRSGNDIHTLADDIILNLVKYLQANQGALYVLNDDDANNAFLEMVGCYAYGRKKHLLSKIEPGQGIAGQVILDKSTLYMTDIPGNYMKITSGLGEALPRHLLIVPLKVNEIVLGLVEMASFSPIKPYQIQFVETIAESIASTISSVKTMLQTKKLLQETQMQSEQMRAVEEEMRQNMEELTATQEEMTRAQQRTEKALKEVSEKEMYMMNMLGASSDGILTVDADFKVVLANEMIKKTFRAQGVEIEPGFDITNLNNPDNGTDFLAPYRKAIGGEIVEVEREYFDHCYLITYNPIRSDKGKTIGVSVFTKDVSVQKRLHREAERKEAIEKQRVLSLERYREVLKSLVKNSDIQNGNLDGALNAITTTLATTLEISRAAVWTYNATEESITLAKMHLSEDSSFVAGGELFRKDIPTYFESVVTEEVIVAKDTFVHPSLIEFRKGYLDVYDIQSMLDVPFFLDGKVGGVICCENQKSQKDWTNEEVEFTKSVADLITVAYKSALTKKLLDDAQLMTEELKAQEEEIRQNMEELSATQEELQRQIYVLQEVKEDLEHREFVFGQTTLLSQADIHGTITLVNDKFCEVSGYSKNELLGVAHKIVRHPDMPSELFRIFWDTIKRGDIFKGIMKNRCKDGSHYWVDATVIPVRDSNGTIVKYTSARYHIKDEVMAVTLYNRQAKQLNLPLLKEPIIMLN